MRFRSRARVITSRPVDNAPSTPLDTGRRNLERVRTSGATRNRRAHAAAVCNRAADTDLAAWPLLVTWPLLVPWPRALTIHLASHTETRGGGQLVIERHDDWVRVEPVAAPRRPFRRYGWCNAAIPPPRPVCPRSGVAPFPRRRLVTEPAERTPNRAATPIDAGVETLCVDELRYHVKRCRPTIRCDEPTVGRLHTGPAMTRKRPNESGMGRPIHRRREGIVAASDRISPKSHTIPHSCSIANQSTAVHRMGCLTSHVNRLRGNGRIVVEQ